MTAIRTRYLNLFITSRYYLRPTEMCVKEFKGSFTPHRMASVKEFDFGFISQIKLIIKIFHFSIFIRNPLVRLDQIMMTPLNHKRPWKNKVSHFSVAESISHIKIGHLPFKTIHKTPGEMNINNLACPISKISRTNRKTIAFQH